MRKGIGAAVLLLSVLASDAAAQVITRSGRGSPRLDARIDQIISNRQYRLISVDTFIARNDTLRGPILSLGNRVVIEGTILGGLTVVDANVYVRPTARIEGDVINIGSGLYRSEQATITGRVEDHPLAPYHVERENGAFVIVGDVEHKLVKPKFLAPYANRVDGITPRLGATFALPTLGRTSIELFGWGSYSFDRPDDWTEKLQGGGELRLRRGLNHIGFGVEETTATNDDWIRSDFNNTISFMGRGKDYRNYFEAERQYVVLGRDLVRDNHAAVASLRFQREDAESLAAQSPWVLFEPDDGFRVNPAISQGVISSGILGLRGEWTGLSAVAEYDAAIEIARDVAGGDFSFNAFEVWAQWAMEALANHTLELETRLSGPLPGTDNLPLQRWGMLGGSGTLYTFEVGEFFGDRVAYLQSEYSIPIDRIRLPVVGSPALELLHSIGMAWTHENSRDFEQNVGVRIQFPLLYARFVVNPVDIEDNKLTFGVSFPKSAYPWQNRAAPRPSIR